MKDYDCIVICSYQPAPFFVLDEVDAALDNTNIGKVSFSNSAAVSKCLSTSSELSEQLTLIITIFVSGCSFYEGASRE